MNEKLDAVLAKVGELCDQWVNEFQQNPIRTTIKVLLIIYVIKKAKSLIASIR